MPLDFPLNPIDGQIYDNYYWDNAAGVWNSLGNYDIPSLLANGTFTSSGSSVVPLTVKGAPSQAANLQEWKNSSDTTLASLSASGGLTLNNALTVGNGGTGATSLTSGAYLKGAGTSAISTQAVPIPIADGGTNATSVAAAQTNLNIGILQVVSTTKLDIFSTTSASFVDVTGASATITPKSASNKILVRITGLVGVNNTNYGPDLLMVRGSTGIAVTSSSTTAVPYSGSTASGVGFALEFLDSPNTTSATTYKLQARVGGGATLTIGYYPVNSNARTITSVVLMEVKA